MKMLYSNYIIQIFDSMYILLILILLIEIFISINIIKYNNKFIEYNMNKITKIIKVIPLLLQNEINLVNIKNINNFIKSDDKNK